MLVVATGSVAGLCIMVLGYCLMAASGRIADVESVVEIRAAGRIWHSALRYGPRGQPYVVDHEGKRIALLSDGSTANGGARWEVLRGPDPYPVALAA